jgi:hypothetical protein
MHFNRRCCTLGAQALLVLFVLGGLMGCRDTITEQDDVLEAPARRVEQNILPPLVDEAEVVLQNLLNFSTALPELCSQPLARMGAFRSSLPALQRAEQRVEDLPRLRDNSGRWIMRWRNVLLANNTDTPTTNAEARRMDITLNLRFESRQQVALRAVPFNLVSQRVLQTVGEPPSLVAGNLEGFFLFQDALTGVWTLRWRALGTPKVFDGRINASTGFSRVMRRLPGGQARIVTSLEVSEDPTQIEFRELTTPDEIKGITFFVRPGERIQFRLAIGTTEDDLEGIERDQLRIGAQDQLVPLDSDADDFALASNFPINPIGSPSFTPETDIGTFLWQDTTTNTCGAGEAQWRLRFRTSPTIPSTFGGEIESAFDEDDVTLSAEAVGGCPEAQAEDGNTRLIYGPCRVTATDDRGYDLCVTAGSRLFFEPEINNVRDPGRVFLGARRMPPPSPDPFIIFFDLDMQQTNAPDGLRFSEGRVRLRGNEDPDEIPDETDDDDDDEEDIISAPLNPDQVSNDPLCSIPGEQVQPRVRLTGSGDYDTERALGNRYTFEDVEFTDRNVTTLAGGDHFPDLGILLLETRQEGEDVEINVPMRQLDTAGAVVQAPIDVTLFVNRVEFNFFNQLVDITVE